MCSRILLAYVVCYMFRVDHLSESLSKEWGGVVRKTGGVEPTQFVDFTFSLFFCRPIFYGWTMLNLNCLIMWSPSTQICSDHAGLHVRGWTHFVEMDSYCLASLRIWTRPRNRPHFVNLIVLQKYGLEVFFNPLSFIFIDGKHAGFHKRICRPMLRAHLTSRKFQLCEALCRSILFAHPFRSWHPFYITL